MPHEKQTLPPDDQVTRWWIIFTDRRATMSVWRWRRYLCRKGFLHCILAIESGGDVITWVDPQPGNVTMVHTIGAPFQIIQAYIEQGAVVLSARKQRAPRGKVKMRAMPIFTCADFVAYFLGMPEIPVTPYRLYRILIKRYGAVELKRRSGDGRRRRRKLGTGGTAAAA